jgi:hypothetical protein
MEYKRTNVRCRLPNRAFADLNTAAKALPTSRSVIAKVACVTLTTGHGSNVAKLCGPATVRAD